MIKRKIKVLERHFDIYGVTLVMRRREIKKMWWLLPGKIIQEKIVTVFTTLDKTLVRRVDFNPPMDWLIVNPKFRHYKTDYLEIDIRGILSDKAMLEVASKVLTY